MKKLVLDAAMVPGLTGMSLAQTGPTAHDNATVSASVVAALTCTSTSPLDFGTVVQGQTKVVSPTAAAPTGGSVGAFTVRGTSNANVIFTFSAPTNLTDAASDNLPFTVATPVYNPTSNTNTTGTTAFSSSGGGTMAMPAATLYIFIGGTVDASGSPNPPTGSYSGAYTLTVQYQ